MSSVGREVQSSTPAPAASRTACWCRSSARLPARSSACSWARNSAYVHGGAAAAAAASPRRAAAVAGNASTALWAIAEVADAAVASMCAPKVVGVRALGGGVGAWGVGEAMEGGGRCAQAER